jgi:hypothetical protein
MVQVVQPRPTFATVAGALALPSVLIWLREHDRHPRPDSNILNALITIFSYERDAYKLAAYCQGEWSWPSDLALVQLLAYADKEAERLMPVAIKEWVISSGVRFPANLNDTVSFLDDQGNEQFGIVQNVFLDTAEALVALVTDLEQRNRQTILLKLCSEEVLLNHA